MTIKQKFDQLVEALKVNGKIELEHCKWRPAKPFAKKDPGRDFVQKFVRKEYKEEIPEDFLYSIEVCNNTHICWRGEFDGKHYFGEFYLASLLDMYANHELHIENYYTDINSLDLKKLSIIDKHPEIGDVHTVYYNRTDGKLYFNYNHNLYQLNINYKEYLEQVAIHIGAGMWPFLFVNEMHMDEYTKQRFNEWLADWNKAKNYLFNE